MISEKVPHNMDLREQLDQAYEQKWKAIDELCGISPESMRGEDDSGHEEKLRTERRTEDGIVFYAGLFATLVILPLVVVAHPVPGDGMGRELYAPTHTELRIKAVRLRENSAGS